MRSDMNKIVQTQALAAEVPKRFRGTIDPSRKVTVTVTEEDPPTRPMSLEEIFAIEALPTRSVEDIDAEVRDLRGEWHERGGE